MKIFSHGGAALRRGVPFGRHRGGAFPLMAAISFFAITATAQTTNSNSLSDAEVQGRQLAGELCNASPAEYLANNGVLEIRDGRGGTSRIPITFESQVAPTNWSDNYKAFGTNKTDKLLVVHAANQANVYFYNAKKLSGAELMVSFAGSDFWIADLGREFFHWPEQKILKNEFMRGRGCRVLESTNPYPVPGAYSRVDSWIDEETPAIVHAEAYGADGRLLKVFDPKSFKKVNGQWDLQDMEIRNVLTGSRTRIEIDLKPN
jgi:hypothetical protein